MGKTNFSDDFKRDAVAQITEHGCPVSLTGKSDREYSVWVEGMRVPHTEDPPVVIQTLCPADLDPLHRTPTYLSLEPSRPQRNRSLSMVSERSVRVGSGYWGWSGEVLLR
jgi:hypothetical protein